MKPMLTLLGSMSAAKIKYDLWPWRSRSRLNRQKFEFSPKWRLGTRKKLFLLQFVMESHNISHDGRPLVGAEKLLDGILIWGPLSTEWIFEIEPPDHYVSNFRKFQRLNGTSEHNETYTHFVRLNEYKKEKIWPLTSGVKGQGHGLKRANFWKITIFTTKMLFYPLFYREP